jgi:outer membrane protein
MSSKKERKMKKFLGLTVFLAALLTLTHAAAGELKIAYVDLQKALNESGAGMRAKEELKKEAQKREEELSSRQEELKKLKEEMDKKRSVWNEETRKKKEEEFQTKSQEFQKQYVQYGEELNKKKQETEGKIIEELRVLVDEMAKKNGYTYVFETSMGGILYGPVEDDITDELIEAYNKKLEQD